MLSGNLTSRFYAESPVFATLTGLCKNNYMYGMISTVKSAYLIDIEYQSLSYKFDYNIDKTANAITSIAIDPSWNYFAIGLSSGDIEIIDVRSNQMINILRNKGEAVRHIMLPDDQRTVIAVYADKSIKQWDLIDRKSTGGIKATDLPDSLNSDHINVIASFYHYYDTIQTNVKSNDLSNKRMYVVFGSSKGLIYLYNISNGFENIGEFDSHDRNAITALAVNDKFLMSGDYYGKVNVYSLKTSLIIRKFELKDTITSLAFSPDRGFIVVGTNKNRALLLSMQFGTIIKEYEPHQNNSIVTSVSIEEC